jgi:hypothetical protein
MDVLKPLRVFIETGERKEHLEQTEHLIGNSSRLLCFTFVTPKLGRYTVPALCGYGDVALWVSTTSRFMFDVSQFWKQIKTQDLCCVYVPKDEKDNPCPSMMLFRNKYCERLTPSYVFNATPEQLAPVVWAGGPQNVGTLEV